MTPAEWKILKWMKAAIRTSCSPAIDEFRRNHELTLRCEDEVIEKMIIYHECQSDASGIGDDDPYTAITQMLFYGTPAKTIQDVLSAIEPMDRSDQQQYIDGLVDEFRLI